MLELEWNVYIEDFNHKQIILYNIFKHHGIIEYLKKTISKLKSELRKIRKDEGNIAHFLDSKKIYFEEEFKKELQYFFWSKSEYEIIVTSWPAFAERQKLEKELQSSSGIRVCVPLDTGSKISVYDQLNLNWKTFINYVWNNLIEAI